MSVLSLMLVVWVWRADWNSTSPGELSAVHSQVPQLAGSDNCIHCHGTSAGELTPSCLACHPAIAEQLRQSRGLHGTLPDGSAERCETCHLEHHGADFKLVDARAFALSGIPKLREFKHDRLDFHLSGRHLTIGCDKCHANAAQDLLPQGQTRFLGLNDDCRSCHQDVHNGSYGSDCASCHGQEHAFRAVAGFSHPDSFPLTGVHADAKCTACHPEGIKRALDHLVAKSGSAPVATRNSRTCADCHTSPHQPGFLARVSRAIGRSAAQSCEHCHPTTHRSFRGSDVTIDVALHAATGFPLTAPHDRVQCNACHKGFGVSKSTAEAFRVCYPGRTADNCEVCHPNPHRGDFVADTLAGKTCLDCHSRTSFRPATLTAARHTETGFTLTSVHQSVACEKCHPGTVAARDAAGKTIPVRHFAGAPTACRECHVDPHKGEFVAGVFKDQDCTICHQEDSFQPARFTLALHARTGFPLSVAHQKIACEKCHTQAVTLRDAVGRTIRVHHFSGTPESCRECHADPHLGQFQVGMFADQDCTACHREDTFVPARFTLEQHAHTGFALTGAHEAVACRNCHSTHITQVLADNRPVRARVFHGTPTDCRGCHADVHRGAFDKPGLPADVDGRTDCLRCHTTDRFDVLADNAFDHELWTGYPLAGAHAEIKCAQCHPRSRVPDELGRTFAPARGRDCQSCHQDPHLSQFGEPEQVDCARCHNVADSFKKLSFDHQTDSRFKLDRTHIRLECAKCHRTYTLENGGHVVRYKPLGTKCGDCHSAGTTTRARSTSRLPSGSDRGGTP